MDVLSLLAQCSKSLDRLAVRRARALESECRLLGIAPSDANLVVLWGGGKDSTIALVLAAAVAQLSGCPLIATTMVHPGLSRGTIENIHRVREVLNISHEWRQFTKTLPTHESCETHWHHLYSSLAKATELHPRFMCVACNFGSLVVEFQALTDNQATFCVTGNPIGELLEFESWARDLKAHFEDTVEFPPALGPPMLDYYRLWWTVYNELLQELDGLTGDEVTARRGQSSLHSLLYRLPEKDDHIANARSFSILEDPEHSYTPVDSRETLAALGWRLPDDIQAGTESDCIMPSAIAALGIRSYGLATYLQNLKDVARVLKPFPDMYERAVNWASTGKSEVQGEKLLQAMGVQPAQGETPAKGTTVALSLVNQLLPVR